MTTQDLQHLAFKERMIPDAPVQDSQTITIDAPIEKVWRIQTDVNNWPKWYPYLRNAELSGSFSAGTELTYGGFPKHHLVIAKVEDQNSVMIYGRYMGFSGVTRWEFQPLSQTQTKVTFTESSAGFLLSVLYSNKKLGEHLRQWLDKLKVEAKRQ